MRGKREKKKIMGSVCHEEEVKEMGPVGDASEGEGARNGRLNVGKWVKVDNRVRREEMWERREERVGNEGKKKGGMDLEAKDKWLGGCSELVNVS